MGELETIQMTLEQKVKVEERRIKIRKFFFTLAIWGLGLITGITAMSSINMYSDLSGRIVLDLK